MYNKTLINRYIVNLCFFLLVVSLGINLFVEAWPRKIFYAVVYTSLLSLIFFCKWENTLEWIKKNKIPLLFAATLCLLGLSKLIWSLYFDAGKFVDIQQNYYKTGKILLCASVVFIYFLKSAGDLKASTFILSMVILTILTLISVYFGYQESVKTNKRIIMQVDAATTTSYIILIQAVVSLSFIRERINSSKIRIVLLLFTFALFALLLLLTQTRSSLAVYFFIFLWFILSQFQQHQKTPLVICLIIFLSAFSFSLYKMEKRIEQISKDLVSLTKDNDNSSIGARVTMLQAGLHVSSLTLLGQSADVRFTTAKEYIHSINPKSIVSISNINYHFHNEILESLSLQGLFGLFSLLVFYVMGLVYALNKNLGYNRGVLMLMFSLGTLGLTDVLFLQNNTVIVITIALIICSQLPQKLAATQKIPT